MGVQAINNEKPCPKPKIPSASSFSYNRSRRALIFLLLRNRVMFKTLTQIINDTNQKDNVWNRRKPIKQVA